MKRLRTLLLRALCGAFVAVAAGCAQLPSGAPLPGTANATPAAAAADTKPLVLLISIDGFKPDYLSRSASPILSQLAREGASARGLVPVFPSITFPSHVSMITGQLPDHHGIVNNVMTDPAIAQRFTLGARDAVENPAWWRQARPIWITAQRQGKSVATMFWPGSDGEIAGERPRDWVRYDHGMPHAARVSTVLGWLARPPAGRPDLVTLYYSDVDSRGHEHGPDSPEVKAAVQAVDRSVGELLAGIDRLGLGARTTVIIVSDHGMAHVPKAHMIAGDRLLQGHPRARWEWTGALAGVRLNGADAAAVLGALAGQPHLQCWPKGGLPARWRFGAHPRIPDVVCVAEIGYIVIDNPARPGPPGMHGYEPQHPDMHGILIASGPRIRPGALDTVNGLDVYALLCALMGIEPGPHDGTQALVRGLLR